MPAVLKRLPNPTIAGLAGASYHEAGHAAAAIELCGGVLMVSVMPERPKNGRATNGHCSWQRWPVAIEEKIILCLAGGAAEAELTGKWDPAGSKMDLEKAEELAGQLRETRTEGAAAVLTRLLAAACAFINRPDVWPGVVALASELQLHRMLTGQQAERIYKHALAEAELESSLRAW